MEMAVCPFTSALLTWVLILIGWNIYWWWTLMEQDSSVVWRRLGGTTWEKIQRVWAYCNVMHSPGIKGDGKSLRQLAIPDLPEKTAVKTMCVLFVSWSLQWQWVWSHSVISEFLCYKPLDHYTKLSFAFI